ncbi:formylglycine-generating enzyme family protein [Breznakiellaceae bacterium SP9]
MVLLIGIAFFIVGFVMIAVHVRMVDSSASARENKVAYILGIMGFVIAVIDIGLNVMQGGITININNGGQAPVTASPTQQSEPPSRKGPSTSVSPEPQQVQPVTVPELPEPPSQNFVRISAGTFTMGSPVNEADRYSNEVQHRVTVSGFSMDKYEVTVANFRAFVNATDYKTEAETSGGAAIWTGSEWARKADANWKNPYFTQTENSPVTCVSWNDAVNYCNWKSRQEGLIPAYTISGTSVSWNRSANGYRLPTEAEWEYACRAGTTTPFSTGSNISTSQANYDGNYPYNGNAKGTYRGKTTPVGSFTANAWGLYDMHGNVWEWCWDWYGDYSSANQTDPVGAASGSYRMWRGGCWGYSAAYLRSALRGRYTPTGRSYHLGFRVVRP